MNSIVQRLRALVQRHDPASDGLTVIRSPWWQFRPTVVTGLPTYLQGLPRRDPDDLDRVIFAAADAQRGTERILAQPPTNKVTLQTLEALDLIHSR